VSKRIYQYHEVVPDMETLRESALAIQDRNDRYEEEIGEITDAIYLVTGQGVYFMVGMIIPRRIIFWQTTKINSVGIDASSRAAMTSCPVAVIWY